MKLSTLIIVFFIPLSILKAQNFLEVDNDNLHLKVDLTRGGAIAYQSESGFKRNLINIYDEGRYVQQSYYAGKAINKLSCMRTDTIYEDVETNQQELPAVYPISSQHRLYSYFGDKT